MATARDPSTPVRILAVKLSSLGDLFHALPAVHCLKTGLHASVDWATQQEYVDLARCFTDVDRVIPVSRRRFLRDLPDLWRNLGQTRYDYVIDFQGLMKSAVVAVLARSGLRIGPSFHREGSRLFYSAVAGKRNLNRHAVDQVLDVVDYFKLPRIRPEFPVAFPPANLAESHPRIGLLPVSRWPSKNWPVARFAELARLLIARLPGLSIFVLGGPADSTAAAQIEGEGRGRIRNLAGRTTLVEMGGLLKELDLLIACDSGPVHMAAAVGTPTLVVFGPTDPSRTGPYGPGHRVVRASLPCQPCFGRTCRRGANPCMEAVEASQVAGIAMEMLNGVR